MNLLKLSVAVLVAMVPVFAHAVVGVPGPDPISVAEPSMFAMLGLGFAALFLAKRK